MRLKSNIVGTGLVGATFASVLMVGFALAFAIGALLWPYTINTWLAYTGKPPAIEWWMGGLMGMVPGLGQACIPAAFVTFILMLFVGA